MFRIEKDGALQPEVTGQESYTLGEDVACSDGHCGHVRSLVVDPVHRTVSHLVVPTRSEGSTGRVVPVEMVEMVDGRCAAALRTGGVRRPAGGAGA